jgi:hypothetical protein
LLFVGDDWAEDHHDVELQDAAGRRSAKTRRCRGDRRGRAAARVDRRASRRDGGPDQVLIGLETDCGRWVAALIAAG